MATLTSLGPRPDAAPPSPISAAGSLRRRLSHPSVFLFVILTSQLMVVLDTTIVNVALPHIQRGLHFSGSGLSWVLNAYLLTFGGLLLLGARSGDLIGRRRTFLFGIAIFTGSSLLGGFAVTGWMLLGARSLQGVGAALVAPSSLALLTTTFSEGSQRVRAIGLFTTVSAAGGAIGLVAGGVLTELVSWRWVMFVNVPIGLVVWAVGYLVLAETPSRHGRFDISGALTSTFGMVGIVLGLVEAGSDGWGSPVTLGAFALGMALLGSFVLIETRAEEPILPLRMLADHTRTAANVSRGLVYAGMYGTFFFMGQFLQDVDRYSPLRAGISFLPIPLSVFASSQLVSKVFVRRVRPKVLMLTGIGMVIVSLMLLSRVDAGTSYATILVSLVLLGLGSGTSLVSLTTASLADVDPADAGAASGMVNLIQQVGAALGLAVLVTVMDATTRHAQLTSAAADSASVVHALDVTFGAAALFACAALVMVAALVRVPTERSAPALVDDHDRADLIELVDAEGFEWFDPDRVA
ncbi:MAG: MFS transporter [Acidimicrobiales bacterium]|jgi:EmrB/QacA subfamily drug resistance transporter